MSAPGGENRGRRGAVVAVLVLVLVVLVALLWIGVPSRQQRLDPRSDARQGTSALMTLLSDLDADVTLDAGVPEPGEGVDVFLVLRDHLDDPDRADLSRWVRRGGIVVVADPASPLAPLATPDRGSPGGEDGEPTSRNRRHPDLAGPVRSVSAGTCTMPVISDPDLRTVEVDGQPTFYPVASSSRACFGDGDEAFVVSDDSGTGAVVSLGSAGILTNEALDQGDNASVAAALLAPRPGTRVAVADLSSPPLPAAGDETLASLVPTWVWRVLAQLGIAFLIYVLWRARRLARPVTEPQPVKVASSELVAAVGTMLERAGSAQHAADLLRSDLHRDLVGRLGLSKELPPDEFFRVVESRCSLDPGWLRLALGPGPVSDDGELLAVAESVDAVRKEVLEVGRTGTRSPTAGEHAGL